MEAATLSQIAQVGQIVILILLAPTLARVFGPRILAWLASRWPGRRRVKAAHIEESAMPRAASAQLAEGRRWLLVGASGSGKTTAARGIVRAYLEAGAEVVVLDPEGAAWPRGARMTGAPDDFAAIGAELAKVGVLATARRAQFMRGVRSFDPVLIVIEEGPAVLRQTTGAVDILSDLARRGRKLGIHLMMLAQDVQAKTLKLEGQLQLLNNFRRLDARKTAQGIELIEGDRVVTRIAFSDEGDLVIPETPDADRLLSGLNTGWGATGLGVPVAGATESATASERHEASLPPLPVAPTVAANQAQIDAPVPVALDLVAGVSLAEQLAILRAATALEALGGPVSRREVCRRVFDSQTGGAAYRKVQAVLDTVNL